MPKLGTKNGGVHVCQDMTEKDEGARKGTQERPYREKIGRIVPPPSSDKVFVFTAVFRSSDREEEEGWCFKNYVEASPC